VRQLTQMRAEGSTPLHLAAEEGRYEVVKKLIDAGAQMDVLSKGTALSKQLLLPPQ